VGAIKPKQDWGKMAIVLQSLTSVGPKTSDVGTLNPLGQ
jgi:hypothetical protein